MAKIAFIGAGSVVFCRRLINDILQVPQLRDSELWLMDIDAERLEMIEALAKKLVANEGLPTKVISTTDRREAVRDAKYVIVTIQVGGLEAYRLDYEIPMKYGVDQCVGDTLGPGGVFRGLRTFPVIVDLARDVERLGASDALIMNYSNPMAMNTWSVFARCRARIVGLCHGVQGTAQMLANHLGVKLDQVDYWCAGINHMAWFLEYQVDGEDAYPKLRELARNEEQVDEWNEKVRYHMFQNFGQNHRIK